MNAPHEARAIKVQNLSLPTFSAFGSYSDMFRAERPQPGAVRSEVYRNFQQLGLSPTGKAGVSICRAEPRQLVIDVLECLRSSTWGVVPVDGDVILQLAPASNSDSVPCEELTVFYVPRGTLCTLNPGVWHYAPYPVGDAPVNILIIQPEEQPGQAAIVRALEPEQQASIEF